jgi:hypothetical protein
VVEARDGIGPDGLAVGDLHGHRVQEREIPDLLDRALDLPGLGYQRVGLGGDG